MWHDKYDEMKIEAFGNRNILKQRSLAAHHLKHLQWPFSRLSVSKTFWKKVSTFITVFVWVELFGCLEKVLCTKYSDFCEKKKFRLVHYVSKKF